ncbi:secretin N-terminal domain-containing protein [Methylobacillus flagellatus]|uniref:NolW-like protein n=2 Tax=root TaxID=1 RepID=Q1H2N6_METFK|nr:secretin N-terminal domain-containing protein [Methylobacillus flagellatus]ABE49107.1 NolW-like protein [Methylobacillus flagellatus KT]ABE49251.1 NolW-like protein [Methylobacillus flagellatus KT]
MRTLLITLPLICLPVQASALDFKMITLQHRFPQDILPAVEQLVLPEGSVTAIDHHLVVRATADKMSEVEALVERLDTAQRNVRIAVRHEDHAMQDNSAIGIDGRLRHGAPEMRGWFEEGVRFGIDDSQATSRRSGEQFLTVMDGERAFIQVGQSVPFTQQWVLLTSQYANIQQTIEFHDVTTGFAVRPRYIGDQVEVEITPRISRINARGFIDFEQLSTTVRAPRGEWLDIGGIMQNHDEVSRAILLQSQSATGKNTRLQIKVD